MNGRIHNNINQGKNWQRTNTICQINCSPAPEDDFKIFWYFSSRQISRSQRISFFFLKMRIMRTVNCLNSIKCPPGNLHFCLLERPHMISYPSSFGNPFSGRKRWKAQVHVCFACVQLGFLWGGVRNGKVTPVNKQFWIFST